MAVFERVRHHVSALKVISGRPAALREHLAARVA